MPLNVTRCSHQCADTTQTPIQGMNVLLAFIDQVLGFPVCSQQAPCCARCIPVLQGPGESAKEEGNAAAKRGDWAAAAAAYERALQLEPGLLAAANNLGLALLKLGRHADAEAACDKVRRAAPGLFVPCGELVE